MRQKRPIHVGHGMRQKRHEYGTCVKRDSFMLDMCQKRPIHVGYDMRRKRKETHSYGTCVKRDPSM